MYWIGLIFASACWSIGCRAFPDFVKFGGALLVGMLYYVAFGEYA